MTSDSISKQIEEIIADIKKTTSEATKSREAAIEYLIEAGIIEAGEPDEEITKKHS